MYIVIAIIIFGVLITVHELGHFTAAKLCGVKVSEFAVGMGPAIIKKQKGETLYSLRALPIGGYCAMEEDEESDDPDSFVNKSWWKRLIILVGGAFMNFLTGFIILLIIMPGLGRSFWQPVLAEFFEGCPYESADGLQLGDEFYKIDGHRIYFTSNIGTYLERGSGVYDIELIRNGEKIILKDYKMVPVEYTIDGETVMKYGFYHGEEDTGFFADIRDSWYASLDIVRMVWMGLGDLITGTVGLNDMAGPVGIVSFISEVGTSADTATDAAFSISYLAAFIAINLGVMNMLPIPALDGGRVLFLLVNTAFEKVTKRKLNPKYEGYVHAAGMVLLLGLMAVVMFSDIYKLFV